MHPWHRTAHVTVLSLSVLLLLTSVGIWATGQSTRTTPQATTGHATTVPTVLVQVGFAQESSTATETRLQHLVPITLSQPSEQTITILYRITDGTAMSGVDHTLIDGKLTFPPGVTTGSLIIPVVNDKEEEIKETLQLELYQPVHATLARSTHTHIIQDND